MSPSPNCSHPVLSSDGRCEACGALAPATGPRSTPPSRDARSAFESRLLRLLLAVPLALFGATFAFFGVVVGTEIGQILLVIALVYFGLCAGVLVAKQPVIRGVFFLLGVIAVFLATKLATMKSPW